MPFSRLPEEVIAQVVDKFILQLEAQLADRNVTIELTDEARAWLVKNGYDEAMGARPMARVIQTQIKTPLADEVLFGKLCLAKGKKTKTVDREHSMDLFYRLIRRGFYLGDQTGAKLYPFPTLDELDDKYHAWWRSASMG